MEKHAVAKTAEGYRILKAPSAPVSDGDLISLRLGGGGGWGNPLERDLESVKNDVLQEYVSVKSAREYYGVVIDPTTMNVDVEASDKLRASAKK